MSWGRFASTGKKVLGKIIKKGEPPKKRKPNHLL
jgi:hypothetical protein